MTPQEAPLQGNADVRSLSARNNPITRTVNELKLSHMGNPNRSVCIHVPEINSFPSVAQGWKLHAYCI